MLSNLNLVIEILFFATMMVIAILSYRQAKKTLFSPIKTEIFKLQIADYQEVLTIFNKQKVFSLDQDFGFHEMFDLNYVLLLNRYIRAKFPDNFDSIEEMEDEMRKEIAGGMYSEHGVRKVPRPDEKVKDKSDDNHHSKKRLAWDEFELLGVSFTKKFWEKINQIEKLAASPLLPDELKDLLNKFIGLMYSNVSKMGEPLQEAARRFPEFYKTPEDIEGYSTAWSWSQYNSKRESPDELVSSILSFINEHLRIKEVME